MQSEIDLGQSWQVRLRRRKNGLVQIAQRRSIICAPGVHRSKIHALQETELHEPSALSSSGRA